MNCFELRHGINCLILVLLARQLAVAQDDGEHDRGSEQSLSQGVSVVLVFFISIFFLTAFTSLCMRQCSNRRFFFHHRGTTSRSPSMPPRERGLDQAVVNTFPTFLYSEVKKIKIGQATLECAVCLLEFEDDEILRLLPEWCHVFHPNCIDAWLILNVTCPLCRANLYPKPGQLIISHMINTNLDRNLTDHQSTSPARNVNGSGSDSDLVDLIIDISDTTTPELIINTPNQRPPRSTPMRLNNTGNSSKFNRSYSTGHLFVHVGENRERFTLRLPENVRSQLMKKSPSSSSPTSGFPSTARSPRKGYRSSSVGTSRGKNYERFDSAGRSGGWNIIMTPPTLSQVNSVRSAGEDDLTATPKNLMRSIKSPLDRLFRGTDKDDGGERSNRRLIPDAQV